MSKPTLQDVLDGNVEDIDKQMEKVALALQVPKGACVECEDARATVKCDTCADIYCTVCFDSLHRKGSRAKHTKTAVAQLSTDPPAAAVGADKGAQAQPTAETGATAMETERPAVPCEPAVDSSLRLLAEKDASDYPRFSAEWFVERAKYIPVRLTLSERKKLRLVTAALSTSDYTGRVDQVFKGKSMRMHTQLQNICGILTGIAVAFSRSQCETELLDRDFKKFTAFYNKTMELARRHKIMNPEKMRSDYGKLVYMLQDTMDPTLQDLLQCQCVRPIVTVYKTLVENKAEAMLRDPLMKAATMEIMPEGKQRYQIDQDIKTKERAIEKLAREYATASLNREQIKSCIYSIGDNHSFLRSNRQPIDAMIALLEQYFSPSTVEESYNLAISAGVDGARLTHDHDKHYRFLHQSLSLWREITDDMFRLWSLAEEDLLADGNTYTLRDTGQGLHRVQAAPRIASAMRRILHRLQGPSWVGSHVVHLGDHNVPNALMFIDKYTQVSRILSPIVLTIRHVEKMTTNAKMSQYLTETFGGAEKLKKDILFDFFRYAFDGSGADNFFDAGSCIDGRLTSAWNWCSRLEQKPFFPIFKLAGFVGFDGDFQQ